MTAAAQPRAGSLARMPDPLRFGGMADAGRGSGEAFGTPDTVGCGTTARNTAPAAPRITAGSVTDVAGGLRDVGWRQR